MLNIDPSELNSAQPIKKQKFYQILYVQVIFAIVVGILLGHFFPHTGEAMKPLGDAFIKIVKMIIAPVIFLTVVTGIAGMTNMKKVGRVAGKSFAYFLTFSTLALLVGMLVANVIQPGSHLNIDPATLDAGKVSTYVDKAKDSSVVGFLMNIIPDTVVSPLVNGNILQVLFVSILFGVSLAMVDYQFAAGIVRARVPHGGDTDEFGSCRRVRRYGVYHRQIRHFIHRQPAVAGGDVLYHVDFVRAGGAGCGGEIQRLFHYQAGEIHQRRNVAGAGHVIVRGGAADFDAENGKSRLRKIGGGLGDSDRLFVQSGRHEYLYDDGGVVHCAGGRH